MYEKYWGLTEKPFENTPDPRFIYYSHKHEEALTRLIYAIKEEKGAAMLSGEYGSGKTLLSRIIIDELIKNKSYEVALITYPQLTSCQFLQEIYYQLVGSEIKGSKMYILHRLQDYIYKNYNNLKKTVIIVDEAQIIKNKETFEELRLLLNFQLNEKFLLTLVLIGQPELIVKIERLPQLEQRIGIRYHLEPLDRRETREYITHRLFIAGRKDPVFAEEALGMIYSYSKGIPRKINNLCDVSLLIGFGQGLNIVDANVVSNIIEDLTGTADKTYAKNV